MPLGPVEILVVQFPGNEVKGDIVPAIDAIVEAQGKVVLIDRIPQGVIEQALAAGVQA